MCVPRQPSLHACVDHVFLSQVRQAAFQSLGPFISTFANPSSSGQYFKDEGKSSEDLSAEDKDRYNIKTLYYICKKHSHYFTTNIFESEMFYSFLFKYLFVMSSVS